MTPDEQRLILEELSRLAIGEVTDVWRTASSLSPSEFRAMMKRALPDVLDPHIASAADLSAVWYEAAAPDIPFRAGAAALPPAEQFAKSASWSLMASGEAGLVRMAGVSKRAVFGGARRTTQLNVSRERGSRWARTASAGACEFCRMVVSRGAVYTSEEAATQVGGNGLPIRGNRDEGSTFHDFCRCMAVALRGGADYQPTTFEESWRDEYYLAKDATDGSTSAILAFMRSGVAA